MLTVLTVDTLLSLNFISFNAIQQLGMSKFLIDPRWKITIKTYDEVKKSSKGLIVLPTWIGLVEKDVVFQVLDILPAYNVLLGRP